MSLHDPPTRGEQADRRRELQALDRIAAALALPHLREARHEANGLVNVNREAHERHIETLDNRIREAEGVLGIPKPPGGEAA